MNFNSKARIKYKCLIINDLQGPGPAKCLEVNDLQKTDLILDLALKLIYIRYMSKQRGRKPGSVSFMQVELNELNRVLKPDAKVIVSIRYAQLVGLNGKAVNSNLDVITHCVASGKAEMKLVDLSSEEEIESPKPNPEKKEERDPDHIAPQAELETFEDDNQPF